MKRLAGLILTAGFFCVGGQLRATDTIPDPIPPEIAPTTPQVSAPVMLDGLLVPRTGPSVVATGYFPTFGVRPVAALRLRAEAGDAHRAWCSDCAPAVRRPLPPPPTGGGCDSGICRVGHVEPAPAACAGGECRTGPSGNCWDRLKTWFCFRPTPIHLPLTPTPRIVPAYTYFPCRETAGCATGTCGAGGHGPRLPGRGAAGCTPCPTPGDAVMPGYRLANPEVPTVVTPPAAGVATTSYYYPPAMTK